MALDDAARFSGLASYAATPKLRDYESYLQAYKLPWVRACVQVIAYNAANVGFRLVDPSKEDVENDDEQVLDSPFLDLLNHPNPYQTGFELREAWWTDLELTGNAYIALEAMTARRQPTELYRLNPAHVTILPDKAAWIKGYRYTVNGRSVDYAADEMLHLRYANPLDPLYGMGTIEAGEARFESERAMAEHERRFWQSGAKITGVLQTSDELDDSTFRRIVGNIKSFFQGSGYSTMLLEHGLTYQSVSDGPAKLGMLDMALASRDQILAMFGVPATKLGILEKANYKADEADRFFWTESIDPKLTRVEDSVGPLVELFHPGQNYRLRFKRLDFSDDVPQMTVAKLMSEVGVYTADEIRQYTGRDPLEDDRGTIVMALSTTVPLDLGGQMATINERRVDQGLPALEGGDNTIILPRGAVPLDVATGEVAPKPPQAAGVALPESVVDQPAAVEGTTPTPDGTAQQTPPEQPTNIARLKPASRRKAVDGPTSTKGRTSVNAPVTAHLLQQHRTRAMADSLTNHAPAVESFFGSQEQRVLARLAAVPRRSKSALNVADLWDDEAEDSALRDALNPVWTHGLKAGLASAQSIGVTVADHTEARLDQVRGGLSQRIPALNATTRAALAETLSEGLRRSYSVSQLANGVATEGYSGLSGVFVAAKAARSSPLVRAETTAAFNRGTLAALKDSGTVTHVELRSWDAGTASDREGEVLDLAGAESLLDSGRAIGLSFVPLQ